MSTLLIWVLFCLRIPYYSGSLYYFVFYCFMFGFGHSYAFMYLDIFLIRNKVFSLFHSVALC